MPHCNGGDYRDPSAAAEMRGVKAEGGWGVIFTEQCEMHHTSEITPFIELRLWVTDQTRDIQADAMVMVTSRQMNDELWLALQARESEWLHAGIRSVKVIGDQLSFRREITQLHLETS